MSRHNLRNVVGFEIKRTLKRMRFWIIALIAPVVSAVVIGLLIFSNSTISGAADGAGDVEFVYSDESGYIDSSVASALGGTLTSDPASAEADVKSGDIAAYIAFPRDLIAEATVVMAQDIGLFGNALYSEVAKEVASSSAQERIADTALATLSQGNLPLTATYFLDGNESSGLLGALPPLIYLAVFFLLLLLLSNQMLNATLEEKENRVTEMILTTVDPAVLVAGKVIALFTVGLIQIVAFLAPAVLAYVFFRDALHIPELDLGSLVFEPQKMIVGAFVLIGGFALFTGTLVAVGAVMPSAKEAGNVFTALILLVILPLYAVSLIISDPGSPIVQLFTYFPFSAPIAGMIRNSFGSLNLLESAVVIVELFVLSAVALRVSVQLFRYGTTSYTDKVSIGRALRRS